MSRQTILLAGERYVLVPQKEMERIELKAEAGDLPPLPQRAEDGTVDALEFSRVTMARDIILTRVQHGLTQQDLARRARIRLGTLRKIESGRYRLSVSTIDKIDRALKQVVKANGRKRPS